MESTHDAELIQYINLKLAALGQPASQTGIAAPLLRNYYQKNQLLGDRLCPVDARIQTFLDSYLDRCAPRLPSQTLVLDMPGLARVMSLPAGEDSLTSPYVRSYRDSSGNPPQSEERPPHDERNLPHCGWRIGHPRRQDRRPEGHLWRAAFTRSDATARSSGVAVYLESAAQSALVYHAAAAASRLPG